MMEVITKLQPSPKLLLFESLSRRMHLSNKDKLTYLNLKKGYEGELLFSKLTENITGEGLILNDLLFEYNQTAFQIDCLIINQAKIFLYEVKNFEGDFYLENEKLFKKPRQEILNPLHQLSRAESLLRQVLLSLGYNTPIDASVFFVNPAFTLYQAPLDIPVIFPNQIHRHLEFVSNQSTSITSNMRRLAAKLLDLRKTEYPFDKPHYAYEELKKGIVCPTCGRVAVNSVKRSCICESCGHKESPTNAVLRSVKEFRLLFPERRVTTGEIYDWCGGVFSKRTVHRILSKHFKAVGVNRWTYFE